MAGNAMGMGMGAGFGMLMPSMIQQAMLNAGRPGAPPMPGSAPAGVPVAAAPVAAGLGGPDFTQLAPAARDPRQLLRSVIQASGWTLAENGDTWIITVPVSTLRKQNVTVDFSRKSQGGHAIIAYSSTCGPATDKNATMLLKFNTQLVHGAFAVAPSPSGDIITLQANQLASTADPLDATRILSALAWQADKVEEQLGGGGDAY